jgi:hypothetical protein
MFVPLNHVECLRALTIPPPDAPAAFPSSYSPLSRHVAQQGKAMSHSSRRDRKAKAVAEVLAMTTHAHTPPAPHRLRPVLEEDEGLFECATAFCAALEQFAKRRATQIKRENHYKAARSVVTVSFHSKKSKSVA